MGAILLIFTGQVWNMAFSFYSSLRASRASCSEAATIYRLLALAALVEFELPFAAIGLVWNSMVSVAGGWFFLMVCEMFVLGEAATSACPASAPTCRPPPATATPAPSSGASLAMIAIIVATDQLIWRPVIAWSDKFKFEQVETIRGSTRLCSTSSNTLAVSNAWLR